MTRFMVIWSPTFEGGESRLGTVDALKTAWAMKAPQLLERRTIELKTTSNPEVLRLCSEWMERYHGKHLKHSIKKLSVVAVSDPKWDENEAFFKESIKAITAGYNSLKRPGTKPFQVYFGVEADGL